MLPQQPEHNPQRGQAVRVQVQEVLPAVAEVIVAAVLPKAAAAIVAEAAAEAEEVIVVVDLHEVVEAEVIAVAELHAEVEAAAEAVEVEDANLSEFFLPIYLNHQRGFA